MSKPIIICVDDERIVLTSLKSELKEAFGDKYSIETAEGGEDALEVFDELMEEERDVPLIISDYIMPDIKGDELLKLIHEKAPGTLKVMLTGQADTQAVGNAVNHAKLYRYIAKPWQSDDLALTVTEAVRSYFQAKQIEAQNEQLREMNRTLEHNVEERTRELSQALEDLQSAQGRLVQSEKMAVLGKLTAGIAHEVNNPIGIVKSSADISNLCVGKIDAVLAEAQGFDDNPEIAKSLRIISSSNENINTASDRVATIVGSLRNFARLDEAKRTKADLRKGLDSTLTLLGHEIPEGINIDKQYGDIPGILCNPGELNQVFMTLLRNAVQAVKPGDSVTISVELVDTMIEVRIADTGKGIAAEQLGSLFELNFTSKSGRVGVGLGLPNAYNTIQKHNGEISVQSEVGKGTEFTLRFPVK